MSEQPSKDSIIPQRVLTSEQEAQAAPPLYAYSDKLTTLLRANGQDYLGFPGTETDITLPSGDTQHIVTGITEPYPKRSPRFGGSLEHKQTPHEHLVITATTEVGKAKEQIGYAVTNIDDQTPRELWYSTRPGYPDSFHKIEEGSEEYDSHLKQFGELAGHIFEKHTTDVNTALEMIGKEQHTTSEELSDESRNKARLELEVQRRAEKEAQKAGFEPDELDDLHHDQTRVLELIRALQRKKDPVSGKRVARGDRPSRSEHRERAAKAAQTLEVSYGISSKNGKVGRAVIETALANLETLDAQRATRTADQEALAAQDDVITAKNLKAERLTQRQAQLEKTKEIISQ